MPKYVRKAASGRFSVNLETGKSGRPFQTAALPLFQGVPLATVEINGSSSIS